MTVGCGYVLGLLCLVTSLGIQTSGLFDYTQGKKVFLNPRLLEWREAAQECENMNGTLLTITDVATMYDLAIDGRWIIWVGFTGNKTYNAWHSRLPVTYTNLLQEDHHSSPGTLEEFCVSVENSVPFWWTAQNCSTKLPSLCEMDTGDVCEFTFQRRSSLIGFSSTFFVDVDLETCKNSCISATQFNCQSFEYNHMRRLCQLSQTNRWAQQGKFTTNDPEWDYYHLDCYIADVNESLIANGWQPTTVPTTQAVTEKICYTVQELLPTENETKEMETAIQELQQLQTIYKDKRRTMNKASATDDRPSAAYLGTIAIIFVTCPLVLIVALDLITIGPHCRKDRKKKMKVSQATRSAEAQAVLAQRRLILSSEISSGTSIMPSTDTDTSSRSSPIEIEDVRIQIRRPVLQAAATSARGSDSATLPLNRVGTQGPYASTLNEPVCVNTEIEIRDTVHATLNTREKDDYSCINAAYVNTSPVLTPFYRSNSDKTTNSGFRKSHSNTSTEQKKGQRKTSTEFSMAPRYSTFGSADFTLWPYNSVDRYYKRSTKYGHEKFILAYGRSSTFQRDEEVESFRC